MAPKLPTVEKLQIRQPLAPADTANVDALDAIIILLPESALQSEWPEFPYSERLRKSAPSGKNPLPPTRADLPNDRGTVAVLATAKARASAFELLSLARKAVAKAREPRPETVGLLLPGWNAEQRAALMDAVVAAVAATNFQPPIFKRETEQFWPVRTLWLFDGKENELDFSRTLAAAEGNALARWLTLLPANHLTPTQYRGYVAQLAKREGWKLEFLDEEKLEEISAGAFLAVSRGSEQRDSGILHLSYRPRGSSKKDRGLALVGKGICYDTGGVNLKAAKSMFGMHGDMQGSAVALGTLLALTRLRMEFPVDAWLAVARNDIGPRAYTQNEVVESMNGTTIEVVHTDAEGRMVLADTLAIAAGKDPVMLLDYATLTGACVTALGSRYSGAFCNRRELEQAVTNAGRLSGERVWPMPVDADYDEVLESAVADVKQCVIENEADHILAARFLSHFVPDSVPWVHIDLAASEHKGGLAHVPTDVTGFGVRFSLSLLLDEKVSS